MYVERRDRERERERMERARILNWYILMANYAE